MRTSSTKGAHVSHGTSAATLAMFAAAIGLLAVGLALGWAAARARRRSQPESREVRNPSEGSEADPRRGSLSFAQASPSREVRNPSEGSEADPRRGSLSFAQASPSRE